jgi:hypothetical protein
MRNILKAAIPLCALLGVQVLNVAVAADDHERPRAEERARPEARPNVRGPTARPTFDGRGQVLDSRYNHGRYYPPVGTVRPNLPPTYRPYYRGGERFYFDGGVWYAPRGPGFVIVRPPRGLVISVLPPYYSTVWFGGVPYYYADNVYYMAQPDQSGYSVVDPPDNADEPSAAPDSPAPQGDLIIYPKNGQSKDQQAADQYECYNWSKGQTGFDPTQPAGGTSGNPDQARNNYNRAMSACLQGRGYQVN